MVLETKSLSSAMNAKIVGTGSESIVLAHGYGGDQSVWDKILPYLAQHYSVLVFDWTFSGAAKDPNLFDPAKYSCYDDFAHDLIALLDELNLKSSVYVGHSMSGMVGCIASIKRPDLFSRLIIIGASPSVLVFDWTFSGAAKDPNLFDPAKYSCYDDFAHDLIALLDELNLKSSVYVGHSMSGMVGCIASIKRPDLFSRLIIIGASPRYLNRDDYEGGFGSSEIKQIISSIESNFHNWAAHFASLVVDSKDPLSVDKFTKCLQKMRPEFALALGKIVFYSDERDTLDKVSTPCTIIHSSNDIVSPKSVAFYMQKKIKGNPKVEIMNANGHFPQLTAHIELLDVLGLILGVEFDLDLDLKPRLGK